MADIAVQFLKQRKVALNEHLDSLQNAIDDLTTYHKLTDAEAECLVQLAGEQAIRLLKSQIGAWESLLRKDKDVAVRRSDMHKFPARLDSYEGPYQY
jgi:hypothetical protein